MKVKYIIALLLLSMAATTLGALWKIMHWQYANEYLTVAMALGALSWILGIVKVLTMDKYQDFLNS